MITFLYGTYGSGKTTAVLESIAKDVQNGIHTFFIVPEQETVQAEHTILQFLSRVSCLSVRMNLRSCLHGRSSRFVQTMPSKMRRARRLVKKLQPPPLFHLPRRPQYRSRVSALFRILRFRRMPKRCICVFRRSIRVLCSMHMQKIMPRSLRLSQGLPLIRYPLFFMTAKPHSITAILPRRCRCLHIFSVSLRHCSDGKM